MTKRHEVRRLLAICLCGATALCRGASPRAQPPARTGAAEPPAPAAGRTLSLREALAAAAGTPARAAGTLRTRAAGALVGAARAWPDPSVGASTTHRTARLGLTGSLPLPIFGTVGASQRVAEAEYGAARAEESGIGLGLRRDVTRAWLELARAEATAVLSRQGAERETQLETIARQRLDAGDASRAEAVAARAAAGRARARADADQAGRAVASAAMAGLLGWDAEVLLQTSGGMPPLPPPPPFARLRGRKASHPDLRAAAARVEAERARVVALRRSRWPSLTIEAEAMLADPTLPDASNPGDDDYRVGLSLTLPLFSRIGARVRAAEYTQQAAAAERAAAATALDGQLRARYTQYRAARERARALADEVLPAQREAAELARAAYREGQGGLVDVLTANAALAAVESEALDSRVDAAIALAELEWAAGGAL